MITPLAAAAIVTYRFRARRPHEAEADYLAALLRHVEARDFAAAHELRVGRRQADWTATDVQAFYDHARRTEHGPREELRPGVQAFEALETGPVEVSRAGLLDYASDCLNAFVAMRERRPTAALAIMASVLLMNGRALATSVDRGDRVALIKALARTRPVFGFVVVCDAFIHSINTAHGTAKATKQDAILAHVGTRDLRIMKIRPYALVNGTAVFEHPPPADIDKATAEACTDSYAGIFVTVPTPTGPPS